jgi:Dolichyl-phosphate-mannose-protein mannosyltransferase
VRSGLTRQLDPSRAVYLAIIAAAIAVGIFARAWFLVHVPISSDEAVAGMIARNVLHGHFQAFYWGQNYGGVEPYIIAALFAVFGQSALVLGLTPVLLTAATAVVTWRIGRRLVSDPMLAVLAGAVVWAAPAVGIENSTIEFGFRAATLFFGALALLASVRIWDGRRRAVDLLGFGLVAGISWWASPESVYFLLPSAFLVVASLVKSDGVARSIRAKQSLAIVASFCVGSLPWLYENLFKGFPSLHTGPVPRSTYAGHLSSFFTRVLPMQLGFDRYSSGERVIAGWAGDVALVVAELVVIVLLVACLTRSGPARAIAVVTIAFPFIYSLSPLAWLWEDGRYATNLPVLLSLVSIVGIEQLQGLVARSVAKSGSPSLGSWGRRAMALTTAAAAALAFATFLTMPNPMRYSSVGWNPEASAQTEVNLLVDRGIRYGFAGYWVAYQLDFLADGRLDLSPTEGDDPRYGPLYEAVLAHRQAAWLFVPPSEYEAASRLFGPRRIQAGGESETVFLDALTDHGIRYKIIDAGLLDAVIPAHRPTLADAIH